MLREHNFPLKESQIEDEDMFRVHLPEMVPPHLPYTPHKKRSVFALDSTPDMISAGDEICTNLKTFRMMILRLQKFRYLTLILILILILREKLTQRNTEELQGVSVLCLVERLSQRNEIYLSFIILHRQCTFL